MCDNILNQIKNINFRMTGESFNIYFVKLYKSFHKYVLMFLS